MRTRIQKWGNSLAVRIPKAFAEKARIEENTAVEVSVRAGKLMIVAVEDLTLEAIVDRITDDNRHDEIDTGRPVGREIW